LNNKERFLKNPHITLDDKRKKQLGIINEDITNDAGFALELPNLDPLTHKEVITRQNRNDEARKSPIIS
jgi:hypothetical protein